MPDHPSEHRDDEATGMGVTPDPVDALVEECLLRMEVEGSWVIDELCRRHPEFAAELRQAISYLREQRLLELDEIGAPSRLGEFELQRRIGGGGMGVVYLAYQPSLGRQVAVKLVRPELMFFPGSRVRFQREVEATARLQHPGIVPVYAVGEQDGLPYFAME